MTTRQIASLAVAGAALSLTVAGCEYARNGESDKEADEQVISAEFQAMNIESIVEANVTDISIEQGSGDDQMIVYQVLVAPGEKVDEKWFRDGGDSVGNEYNMEIM